MLLLPNYLVELVLFVFVLRAALLDWVYADDTAAELLVSEEEQRVLASQWLDGTRTYFKNRHTALCDVFSLHKPVEGLELGSDHAFVKV